MIRKRSLISDIYDCKRRKQECGQTVMNTNHRRSKKLPLGATPSDTKSALSYISTIFPTEKFNNRLPPIVMRHQIYAFVQNRTQVDRELNELRKNGEVRLFKLGMQESQLAAVYTKDYIAYVESCCRSSQKVGNFLKNVVSVCPDITYTNDYLKEEFEFKEDDITELIREGVLTVRDVGCYWLSIPRVGEFMKTFIFGRRAMLQHVRRNKYKEILQSELESRKLPRKAFLGVLYHIYDIIGSDAVTCVQTSTGIVLRMQLEAIR